ncbi:MAG TPA: aspartate dehydrogenase [Xanthobacteraceae bacterium]|jgi:aspartate dehydrogenase
MVAATRKRANQRFGVIGFGAIGDEIVRCLDVRAETDALVGFLDLPERMPELKRKSAGRFPAVSELDGLLALGPDLVVEAAGHSAVKRFGAEILARGYDLLIASVGAVADKVLAGALVAAAEKAGTDLWIASGAVAGIDGLLAARDSGLRTVTYTSAKPPQGWAGTPAETILMHRRSERVVFFEANAREAAAQYPQNANVAATVALAGLGLDRTRVQLVSDPAVKGPLGTIEAHGEFGHFLFEILALASPTNPKTSAITGFSLVSAVREGMAFRALDLVRDSL